MNNNGLIVQNMKDVHNAALAMSNSKYFQDAKEASQAMVKVMAGYEMGFGPFASMTGIHVIQGKPAIGANLIAAAIKRHPMYNFKVTKHDNTICVIEFYENWNGKFEKVGESSFSMEDAKTAKLTGNSTWQKYPKNMLFSRALSNGAKWYTPDVFGGSPMYTPDELGATIDEDVIEAEIMEEPTLTGQVVGEDENFSLTDKKGTVTHEPVKTAVVGDSDALEIQYLDWVMEVRNRDGVAYPELPTEKLSYMLNGLKHYKEPNEEKKLKIKAIEYILGLRNE